MVSVQNLTVVYGMKPVLDNINIEFPNGNIIGIVGFNGAGKTTFFNALSNIVKPDSGALYLNEKLFTKKDVCHLETVNFFYSKLTGNEYLKIFKQSNSNFSLSSLQEFFQLPLDDLIETYSTGMKKKLALLGVLKQDSSIYLFDEPFNGLDLETNKIVEMIIMALKEKGKTVFVSSHILDPLISICDAVHFLEKGKFTKSFDKNSFDKMENELFGKLKGYAQNVIANAV